MPGGRLMALAMFVVSPFAPDDDGDRGYAPPVAVLADEMKAEALADDIGGDVTRLEFDCVPEPVETGWSASFSPSPLWPMVDGAAEHVAVARIVKWPWDDDTTPVKHECRIENRRGGMNATIRATSPARDGAVGLVEMGALVVGCCLWATGPFPDARSGWDRMIDDAMDGYVEELKRQMNTSLWGMPNVERAADADGKVTVAVRKVDL